MPKANFNFTFDRFVEHHNQGVNDSLVKQRVKNSFSLLNNFPADTIDNIKTPLTHSELNVAWSFFEDNFEILENLIFDHITSNYTDGHEGSVDEVIFED